MDRVANAFFLLTNPEDFAGFNEEWAAGSRRIRRPAAGQASARHPELPDLGVGRGRGRLRRVSVPARISIVTIGVADGPVRGLLRAARLGTLRLVDGRDRLVRTEADSYLGIFGWTDLAEDARIEDASRGGFGGITLAINVETPEMVDQAIADAVAAGGSILKPGTDLPFGYGGYFADPDGHPLGGLLQRWLPVRAGWADRHRLKAPFVVG